MNNGFFKWVANVINGDTTKNNAKSKQPNNTTTPKEEPAAATQEHTVVEQPATAPKAAEQPAAAPKAAEQPAVAPKVAEQPAAAPKATEQPKEDKTAEQPAAAPKAAEQPAAAPKATEQPKEDASKEKQTPKHENPSDDVHMDNGIKRREDLIFSVIKALRMTYRGTDTHFDDKILKLWIADSLFFDSINNLSFINDMTVKIYNETGFQFNRITIHQPPIPPTVSPTAINSFAHLHIEQVIQEEIKVHRSAVIKVLEGCGSTLKEEYILDSEQIMQRSDKRYNIGRGARPTINSIISRENYIAIDDNPQSAQYENNKYVSRAHAHIKYTPEDGFLLYVEQGGSSLAQKRTHIQRGMDLIPIDNVLIPTPLKDGDYIILSKHVKLMFNEK